MVWAKEPQQQQQNSLTGTVASTGMTQQPSSNVAQLLVGLLGTLTQQQGEAAAMPIPTSKFAQALKQ